MFIIKFNSLNQMQREIELTILDIDVEKFKLRLEEVGAKKIKAGLMRRYVYFLNEKGYRWIRSRR